MAANTYQIGDLVKISATFAVAGVATDPTTVTLKVRSPSGTVTTYTYALGEITKDSTGNYHKDISPDTVGYWYYKWIGTGTVVTVEEGYFEAQATVIV